jgi:ATP-binding cassette subfamily B (MDR/TAP) protein 1
MPFVISTGYTRVVGFPSLCFWTWGAQSHCFQRVVVLKDQRDKKAHEESARLACEAAGAIRTVASLTREDDCLELYSKSLEQPRRETNSTTLWSNLLFSLSQSFPFYVLSLTFWYGSRLVSNGEFTAEQFFTGLMVSRNYNQGRRQLTDIALKGDRIRCHPGRQCACICA